MYFWCEEQRSENSISNPGFKIINFVQLVRWLPGEHFYCMGSDINLHQKKNLQLLHFAIITSFASWTHFIESSPPRTVKVLLLLSCGSQMSPKIVPKKDGDLKATWVSSISSINVSGYESSGCSDSSSDSHRTSPDSQGLMSEVEFPSWSGRTPRCTNR